MTGSILNDSFCPLPFACWASPPPSRQAFNSLLPPISLSPPSSPFWAHPEKSKSPCPVETAYSRQGPKVPVESQPDARHKHSPERAQPGSPATWSGAQRLPATPGCVSRASRGHSASSVLSSRSLRSHRATLAAPLGYGEDPCAPEEARGPPPRPGHPCHPRAGPSVPSGQGMRGSAWPLPGECPAWVRAPVTPGESSDSGRALLTSRRGPVRESVDAPGLGGVPEPQSPGPQELSLGQRWLPGAPPPPGATARTYQMKSVQWLQKVGCLKKRAMNLWSFTSCTFFCLSAPLRAKRLATS